MESIVAALGESRVWDAESAFLALNSAGVAASRRTAERQLHKTGIWPDALSAETLRDGNDVPADTILLNIELDQARSQRHLALFTSLVAIPDGPVYVHANDARGARMWVPLTDVKNLRSVNREAVHTALGQLQKHVGKTIVVFAHQALNRFCTPETVLPEIQIARTSCETAMEAFALPGPGGRGDKKQATALVELENIAIRVVRNVLPGSARGVLALSADKRTAVLMHLARKAFFPEVPPISVLASQKQNAGEAQRYLDQVRCLYDFGDASASRADDSTVPLDANAVIGNWTESQIFQYISDEQIPICSLYLARRRPVVKQDGVWTLVDTQTPVAAKPKTRMKLVRFEEMNDDFVSGAIESDAVSLTALVNEVAALETSKVKDVRKESESVQSPLLANAERIHRLSTPAPSKTARVSPVFMVQRVTQSPAGACALGWLARGRLTAGAELTTAQSDQKLNLLAIKNFDGEVLQAESGQAVSLELEMSRNSGQNSGDNSDPGLVQGDVLCQSGDSLANSDHIEATVLWLSDKAGMSGRNINLVLAGQRTGATVSQIKHRVDPQTDTKHAVTTMDNSGVYVCTVSTDQPVVFDPNDPGGVLDRFELIDPDDNEKLAIGFISHGLRRGTNIHEQQLTVARADRERTNSHVGKVIWFTGLSGSGKSTIANALEVAMHRDGLHTYILDGDNVRLGLNKDLGFTDADRVENIRRIAEVARLMMDAGLIVMTAFISPFIREREMARDLVGAEHFYEVHVETPLAVCEQRDIKGLYKKARRGDLPNMTGIDSPYEAPTDPTIRISTENSDISQVVAQIREKIG